MEFVPIELPESFPLVSGDISSQGDAPITYLHNHDCLELGYCHAGSGIFVVGEKVLSFQTGAVSFITSREFHLARSMAGTESKWTWLYLDPARLLEKAPFDVEMAGLHRLSGKFFRNIIGPQIDPLVGILARQLVEELRVKPKGYRLACRGLVETLMVRVNRLNSKTKIVVDDLQAKSVYTRMAPALDLMAARYQEDLSMKVLAKSCSMSVTHFRRLFRLAMKQSPHRYLSGLRVQMAATRLHTTDEKVVEIAHEAGFTTLSSFNRAFRHVMKVTPRQWRQQS